MDAMSLTKTSTLQRTMMCEQPARLHASKLFLYAYRGGWFTDIQRSFRGDAAPVQIRGDGREVELSVFSVRDELEITDLEVVCLELADL